MNLLRLLKLARRVESVLEYPEEQRRQFIRNCERRGLTQAQADLALQALRETLLHG